MRRRDDPADFSLKTSCFRDSRRSRSTESLKRQTNQLRSATVTLKSTHFLSCNITSDTCSANRRRLDEESMLIIDGKNILKRICTTGEGLHGTNSGTDVLQMFYRCSECWYRVLHLNISLFLMSLSSDPPHCLWFIMWLNLSHYCIIIIFIIFIFIIFIFRTACQQTGSSNMIKEGEEEKEGRYWTSTSWFSSNHIESAPSEGGVTTMERLKKRKKLRGCEWERKRKKRRKRKKQDEEINTRRQNKEKN